MHSRWLLGGLLALTIACPPAPAIPEDEVCNDGLDNDLDEQIDCADSDCAGDSALCPNFEVCNDGIDNDVDGFVDCIDTGCVGEPICNEGQNCTDQEDNDGDGATDCEDSECTAHPACEEEIDCNDGLDNDQDGFVDCRDPGCNITCPAFSLTVSTELNGSNGLVLHTNLPARTGDCQAFPRTNTPCADNDQDGLADAWEDIVLDRFRPVQRLDEDESLVTDPESVLGDVGRVALALSSTPGAPFRAHMMLMLGYAKDYGSCGGFTSHNGDSERIAVNVEQIAGTLGDVQTVQYFTTGHEGTSNDQSRIFNTQDFGQLVYTTTFDAGQPRWVVFPSADKHATYATAAICEGVSIIPCLDEDCGPDGVSNPAAFNLLPDFVNAGEDNARLVTSLSQLGFPGDDAWAVQDFCGGLDRSGECSSDVRDKLVNDPFGAF